MRKLRYGLICLAVVQAMVWAADPGLLSMVMPDAKVMAGAQVGRVKGSPFGAYVLSHLQLDDPEFQKFMAATGFDPRRDLTELLIASSASQNDPSSWLVLGKGTFDAARIQGIAQSSGATVTPHKGITIIVFNPSQANGQPQKKPATATAIAVLDASTAVMGAPDAVTAAIDRRTARGGVSTSLAAKVRQVSASNDFWFTTLVPLSEFAGAMPDTGLSAALKGNMLQAVQQASGGIQFGTNIVLSAEIVTRSPQDAQALVDVFKFIAGLIQTNRKNDKTAEKVSTVLDSLRCSAQGNVMTMSLAVPEAALEQMLESMRQERKAPKKSPQPVPNK